MDERDQQWGPRPPEPPASRGQPRERRWYKSWFLWFFLAVQLVFIIWLAVGLGDATGTLQDCSGLSKEIPPGEVLSPYDKCQTENAGTETGTTIGAGLVIGLWVAVDFILAVSYGIYRLAKR
ncbi:hypothetical protein [Streptomyces meridianus]|uniref:Uncharacterized protein n=1 Tax=Streptomyces meridianus TaxID=2938945 RepID=A0ABT0X0S1_9ACTN|nr:hypothetical protein [Streptomyces meridianus]MCM2576159.1 hypothetical protein [Streptomyces meridianus]